MNARTPFVPADYLRGLPTISRAELTRRQTEHHVRCEALCQLHLQQLLQALRDDAAREGWWSRLVTELALKLTREDLLNIAWSRAALALSAWGYYACNEPLTPEDARALRSAQEGLVYSPQRAQECFAQPLAQALLTVVRAPALAP